MLEDVLAPNIYEIGLDVRKQFSSRANSPVIKFNLKHFQIMRVKTEIVGQVPDNPNAGITSVF
jgi:hypothetical protein